jgi:hypothetical protein
MSEAWRKPAPRRIGILFRTSPKRLFIITICFFFTFLFLVAGSFKARHYIKEKEAEAEAARNAGYHWQKFPR